jgi:hypothetical protein
MPMAERLLLLLHNLCAMRPEVSKTSLELSDLVRTKTVNFISDLMKIHESEGYVRSCIDDRGSKSFYLTESGIIRVCSFFT